MENYQETPGRARELEHCANPMCGHRRLHHHPRAGVCMVSAHQIDSTGWCPCDEFEARVDREEPRCTYVDDMTGRGGMVVCGARLEKREMECVKCERGHWMARPDLFESSEPDDGEPEPEDALTTAFARSARLRIDWAKLPYPDDPTSVLTAEERAIVDEQIARAHAVADGHVSLTAAHRALDQAADVQRRNDLARARRASVLHPEVQAAAAERVDVVPTPGTVGPFVMEFWKDGGIIATVAEGARLDNVPDGTYQVRYRTLMSRTVTIVNGTRIEQP